MHGFRDIKVLLQAGYDVIVILPPGAFQAIFHDGFWKSDHDFLIAFHSNFLSAMHGFRDIKVLLQAGYDVIVISPLGACQASFYDVFWKSDYEFLLVVTGNFCPNLNCLEVIRHFLFVFAWDFPTGSEILGVLGKMTPRKWKYRKTRLNGTSLSQSASFELLCVEMVHGCRLYACQGI